MGVTIRSPSGDRRAEMERQQLERHREAQARASAARDAASGGAAYAEQACPTGEREATPQSVALNPKTPRRTTERLVQGREPGPSVPLPDPGVASPARADMTLNHEPRAAPSISALVRHECHRSSRASVTSRASMVELRRRMAQQESQRKLLEISRREIEIDRELMEIDHQIKMNRLEIEKSESRSSASNKSIDKINDWLEENFIISDNDKDGAGPRSARYSPPRSPCRIAPAQCAQPARAPPIEPRPQAPPFQSVPRSRRVHTPLAPPPAVREYTSEPKQHEVCGKSQCATYCRCGSREQSSASLEQVMSQLVALNSRPTTKQLYDLPIFTGIPKRLSPHVRSRWCQYAEEKLEKAESELSLMVNFLLDISDKELQYSHARGASTRHSAPPPAHDDRRGARRAPASNPLAAGGVIRKFPSRVQTFTTDKSEPCLCCGGVHTTTSCKRLLDMSVTARWDWAKHNKICFKCLDRKHRRGSCQAGLCGVQGCQHPHHRLLHDQPELLRRESLLRRELQPPVTPASQPIEPERAQNTFMTTERERTPPVPARHFVLNTEHLEPSDVLLKVIPIMLYGPAGEIKCYALCDDGSTISLCEDSIAEAVGAEGVDMPLHINGIGPMSTVEPSRRVTVQIRGLTGENTHLVRLRTIKNLGINSQRVPKSLIKR
ncbi:uncharacterized protein LOC125230633 [Leguminivora glycinivorella]|uniref:uncharacterized protein LOC125230633 n=1 Tax=Leguminivora glycinivorella TaxID=1035111 RepID=UPI00200F2697|nr:uncharacterized protein LOC125230633 [Leguminivora glycinivorella]